MSVLIQAAFKFVRGQPMRGVFVSDTPCYSRLIIRVRGMSQMKQERPNLRLLQ